MSKYNGWKNYETWCVKLWFDNDQGTYEHWREEARNALEQAADDSDVISGRFTLRQSAILILADSIKQNLEDFHPFDGEFVDKPRQPDLYSDLLRAAIREVDCWEIAGAYLDDLAEETN